MAQFATIHQSPRTVGHCAKNGLHIRVVCVAGHEPRHVAARDVCAGFSDWTVEALQRSGALGCGQCRRPAALAVVGSYWAQRSDFETWPTDGPGWVRKQTDGMDG